MSQIFPDCDLRLWDLLPLEFISILITFSPHHCDGGAGTIVHGPVEEEAHWTKNV